METQLLRNLTRVQQMTSCYPQRNRVPSAIKLYWGLLGVFTKPVLLVLFLELVQSCDPAQQV